MVGADGHDQAVDEDVFLRDAHGDGAVDDLVGDGDASVDVGRDAFVVHAEADEGGAVLFDERQEGGHGLLFAGDGVDDGLALVELEGGVEGLRVVAVDADGDVDGVHDGLEGDGQRLYRVEAGEAHVDVEDVGAGFDLGDGGEADEFHVAFHEGGGELLLAGRVDALADEDGGPAVADEDFSGGG